MAFGKLFTPVCLWGSITKQHNLVREKVVICSAGKVTAILVESNGSLPLGL